MSLGSRGVVRVPSYLLAILTAAGCGRTGYDWFSEADLTTDIGIDARLTGVPPPDCSEFANPPVEPSAFDATPYCWRGRECVQVIYDESYADYLPAIERALTAWEERRCSDLCFGQPEPVPTIWDNRDGAIAFGPWRTEGPPEEHLRNRPIAGFAFDVRGDVIESGLVEWNRELVPPDLDCLQPLMTRAVGLALGIEDERVTSPSLMTFDDVAINSNDNAAFCEKYGSEGHCPR